MRPYYAWLDLRKAEAPVGIPSLAEAVDVSVVLPCLDEEDSVVACLKEAKDTLQGMGVRFELIVVDNGSTDHSALLALQAGAKVIHETVRGYGSACRAGLRAARGQFIVLGDADGTYDFKAIPQLVESLSAGSDLAIGNRLVGVMEAGAMPWLHRHVGTPTIGRLVSLLYGERVGDVNCGLRAVTQHALRNMRFSASGMEFASEMVVRAAENGLTISQTPINYRLRSGGEAKLRTWSDGWRNVCLIVASWVRYRTAHGGFATMARSGALLATEPDVRHGELHADSPRL